MPSKKEYFTTRRGKVHSTSKAQHKLLHARKLSHTHVTEINGKKTYNRHKFGKPENPRGGDISMLISEIALMLIVLGVLGFFFWGDIENAIKGFMAFLTP